MTLGSSSHASRSSRQAARPRRRVPPCRPPAPPSPRPTCGSASGIIADDSMMGRESGLGGRLQDRRVRRRRVQAARPRAGRRERHVLPDGAVLDRRARSGLDARRGRHRARGRPRFHAREHGGERAHPERRPRDLRGGPAADSSRWISAAQAAGKVVVLDVPEGRSLRGLAIGSGRWR